MDISESLTKRRYWLHYRKYALKFATVSVMNKLTLWKPNTKLPFNKCQYLTICCLSNKNQSYYLAQVLCSFFDLQLLADLAADLLLDLFQLLLDHGVGQVQIVSQTQSLCHHLAPGIPLWEERRERRRKKKCR